MKNDTVIRQMEEAAAEAEKRYGDILDLPRPVSAKHPPLSRMSRAAQFSPFAALTGYDEAIRQTARLTEEKPELSEDEKQKLDQMIREIQREESTVPVRLTWFVEDSEKQGGSFRTRTCRIKEISTVYRTLITDNGEKIRFDDLIEMEFI